MDGMTMNSGQNVSDAGLYTDFSGLAKLRAKATGQSDEAAKEVAKQFESLFLQMMLKSMRDATIPGESAESEQTKFYQEMFDKQIALDLSSKGDGIGLAKMLEKQISGSQNIQSENIQNENAPSSGLPERSDLTLIRQQIERPTASILNKSSGTIYHVSPEGFYMDVDGRATQGAVAEVSHMDDTNNEQSSGQE